MRRAALLVLVLGLASSPVPAAEPSDPQPAPAASPAYHDAHAYAAAHALARAGRRARSPYQLLGAALALGKLHNVRKFDPADATTESKPVEVDTLDECSDLIKDALKLGGTDVKELADAVTRSIKQVPRGATDKGPRSWNGYVAKGTTKDEYLVKFKPGERATVMLMHLGGKGDVELRVTDPDGKLLRDPRRQCDDDEVVTFVPATAKPYKITVTAYAEKGPVRFRVLTN